jgi:hypothetical protein
MAPIKSANRRDFLGKVTGAAALMGVASLVNPAKASDSIRPFSRNADDPEEWFKGVKGKHRLVFDCTEPANFPFAWPKICDDERAIKVPQADCTAVVVLR